MHRLLFSRFIKNEMIKAFKKKETDSTVTFDLDVK